MKKVSVRMLFTGVIIALFLMSILSIAYGSKSIGFLDVLQAIFSSGEDSFAMSVIAQRIPRTIFGILAGAALAVSGCLMQSITRNPIADPSILGVNTGAALAVVSGISWFGISSSSQYIWFAFGGAMLTAFFVYGIASCGYDGATPIKLALAGAATSTALTSLVSAIMMPDANVMDRFRFWQIGSIGPADWDSILSILPYLIIGFIMAICLSNALNTLALGDELASGLGIHTKTTRALAACAGVLLCAATTALAGPIGFIGLMVPHFIRMLIGSDMRIVLPLSALNGSILLLFADVVGRIIARPSEMEVGIITALFGAPVFIYIVRKAKVKGL